MISGGSRDTETNDVEKSTLQQRNKLHFKRIAVKNNLFILFCNISVFAEHIHAALVNIRHLIQVFFTSIILNMPWIDRLLDDRTRYYTSACAML